MAPRGTCILPRMSWGRVGSHVLFWMAIAFFLSWGHLSARVRRSLSLLVSAAGVLFLILGLNTEGRHDAPTTGAFLLGSSYVTGRISAAASLPYYVMTGTCLLLGTVGLALPQAGADRLAEHRVAAAVALSAMVTLVRFGLEQAAAPTSWTRVVGITGLAPVVGAYFALTLMPEKRRVRPFFLGLLVYALSVRAWVAALYVAATVLRLGSHYDLSAVVQLTVPLAGDRRFEPGSWAQILNLAILPQLTFWPLFTMFAGTMGGGLGVLVSWASTRGRRAERAATTR